MEGVARVVGVEGPFGVSPGRALFRSGEVIEGITVDALAFHVLHALTYYVAAYNGADVFSRLVSAPAVFAGGGVDTHAP